MNPQRTRRLMGIAALKGDVLAVIGLRFLIAPEAASRFFAPARALPGSSSITSVHCAISGLGALAVALAVWFALGALVCLGDAAIVVTATAKPLAIAFHLASGALCAALAVVL